MGKCYSKLPHVKVPLICFQKGKSTHSVAAETMNPILLEVFPNIPDDVLLEILRRIPTKSLLRFKCVSKHWCSSIEDPTFVYSHLALATEKELEVYTLGGRGNSWKNIKCPSDFRFGNYCGKITYANGNLHWRFDCTTLSRMITFNLSDEEFRTIGVPDVILMNQDYDLLEFGGYVTLMHAPSNERKALSLWVLKDYNKRVWVKQWTFQLPHEPLYDSGLLLISNNIILMQSKENEFHYACHYDNLGQLLKCKPYHGYGTVKV
ncbi:hypothetical protein IFM89_009494 [Coptis chinensis]|uniref:F-box domain-containing protein n=1 Tax=Coptis chinensis TaxID=261450 RepID=A0A835H292_9MAGN|nr:hypothetical protein IFM89_009494 [Coptis chinensis]